MYGGATLSGQYLNSARKILLIFGLMANIKQFLLTKIATNKKLVTAQEIDVKLRRYLQENTIYMVIITLVKAKNMDINLNFIQVLIMGKFLFHLNNEKSFHMICFIQGMDCL